MLEDEREQSRRQVAGLRSKGLAYKGIQFGLDLWPWGLGIKSHAVKASTRPFKGF